MPKKSADTMLTRLDTTIGRLVVSAMNPVAITNANAALGWNFRASSIWNTMGVRISAAPSLANSAAIAAPSTTMRLNSVRPLPRPQRATCSAAHWNVPASSSTSEMMMTATKVAVAFHTMPHTVGTSLRWTTPVARATAAPPRALNPIPSPRGCQITSVKVAAKMIRASNMRGAPGGWGCRTSRRA